MRLIDGVCREAVRVLSAQVAWVGVPSSDGEHVLAAAGASCPRLSGEFAFTAAMAQATEPVVVEDARRDPRFARHPLVTGPPHLRMYAGFPIRDRSGNFRGVLSAVSAESFQPSADDVRLVALLADAIAREMSQADAVSEAEERFRDFFEASSDLIISLSTTGRVLHANEIVEPVLALKSGDSLVAAVEKGRREEFARTLERVVAGGYAERVETLFVGAGGVTVTLEGWLRPRLVEGKVALVRVVFRDVSDRKQFETELGNARDAALQAARARTQFLANVSHEIRTPMNGIVGMIDLLLNSSLDEEQRDFAHQARSSAESLLSIVHNVLYISNLEAGGLAPARVDFEVRPMVERITDVARIAALGRNLEIGFECMPGTPAVLRGNQSKVRHVLSNLVDNAIKFTDQGKVTIRVSLQSETENRFVVRFEVQDSGPGISDEDRVQLFERFAQLDAASTRRHHGVGLGLATARHLVETMGGLIDVESEPGKGSRFWFTIPFLKPASEQQLIPTSEFSVAGRRVLLLGGESRDRRTLLHYLQNTWEMRVDVVASEAEAVERLAAAAGDDPYQLFICDAALRSQRPLAAVSRIRSDARFGDVPVLCLVDSPREVNEESMRSAGVSAWTQVPIGHRELFDALAIAMAPRATNAPPRPAEKLVTAPEVQTALDPSALRLLLAEDNFLNMKLTMSQLKKLGYSADLAANGREVLEAVSRREYDVILMDCQMPILDGYDATLEIRRMEKSGGRPRHWIIAMTANALEGDREKCLAAGMDDYLAKPTHQEELSRALQAGGSRVRR